MVRRLYSSSASDRLIVALDAHTLTHAVSLGRALRGIVTTVKIGSVLFTACGPDSIQRLRSLGFQVMLDLKFFDIPSTMERSCRAAVHHRVSLLTVHAMSGRAGLEAAVHGVKSEARLLRTTRPLVLGVTVLTSVSKNPITSVAGRVARLTTAVLQAGCDGVVASSLEAAKLRHRFGRRLRIACPGIRTTSMRIGDQRRVSTPSAAIKGGADWLIVGRPITASARPRLVAKKILEEMERSLRC